MAMVEHEGTQPKYLLFPIEPKKVAALIKLIQLDFFSNRMIQNRVSVKLANSNALYFTKKSFPSSKPHHPAECIQFLSRG